MTSLPVPVLRSIRSGITARPCLSPLQLVGHSIMEVVMVQSLGPRIHPGVAFRSHFQPLTGWVHPRHAIDSKFYKEHVAVICRVQAATNLCRYQQAILVVEREFVFAMKQKPSSLFLLPQTTTTPHILPLSSIESRQISTAFPKLALRRARLSDERKPLPISGLANETRRDSSRVSC